MKLCRNAGFVGGCDWGRGHSTVPLSPPSFGAAGFFLNFSHQVVNDTFADGGEDP
jgi:hypothetical protein